MNDPGLSKEEREARRAHITHQIVESSFMAGDMTTIGLESVHIVNKGMKAFNATKFFKVSSISGVAWVF